MGREEYWEVAILNMVGVGPIDGEGNGNPLQCSCLENLIDREAWQATVHGVTNSQTGLATEQKQQISGHLLYSDHQFGSV